ncbi:MAG: class I SAM-dependent methyltransferase [Verrucomicrobiaceae bacterium]
MSASSNSPCDDKWYPPSSVLELHDGLWRPAVVSSVSYPEDGNETCLQVEDGSYWFAHRNRCILAAMQHFPPQGTVYDIGGGNGFVAQGMQNAGHDVVLVEPGSGARNAVRRGVKKVIWATLADAGLQAQSMPAAGAFDVVEHIEDDVGFLNVIKDGLEPGGRFYCTVPASSLLWSDEDVHAGHYRRYTRSSLARAMEKAGMEVEYVTQMFAWLVLPVLALRMLPFRIRGSRKANLSTVQSDHRLPAMLDGLVGRLHEWELSRIKAAKSVFPGTSLLCVARAPKR